jgi:hypothetical protein
MACGKPSKKPAPSTRTDAVVPSTVMVAVPLAPLPLAWVRFAV